MYWYYKVPFLVFCGLVVAGCLYLVVSHLPQGVKDKITFRQTEQPGDGPRVVPSDNVDGGGDGPRVVPATSDFPGAQELLPEAALRRLEAAEEQLRNDNLLAARKLGAMAMTDLAGQEFGEHWFRAAEVVSRVNTTLLNSDAPAPEKVDYIVEQGDMLAIIARRFGTTIEALQRGNNLDMNNPLIYPGDVLKIYKADWHLLAIKSRFVLLLYDGEVLFKLYHVGIGRQNRTPAGDFEIKNKLREPAWTPPGRVIPYGDPQNVLGTRWLGLKPVGNTNPALRGYGIHGTWEPDTVGTPASEGCIRMRNEDVEELFDIVPVGTRVVIKDE